MPAATLPITAHHVMQQKVTRQTNHGSSALLYKFSELLLVMRCGCWLIFVLVEEKVFLSGVIRPYVFYIFIYLALIFKLL